MIIKEDCGCKGGNKETSQQDPIVSNWVDNNLSKINQMVGDMNECPPGQHWCDKSHECHDDHSSLSEEFDYESVLEDSSSRLPEHFYEDDYTLDKGDLDVIFDETQRGRRVRYFVDVYYDTMLPSSGDAEKDKILAEKIARADLRSLKNREYIIGPVELRGYYN